MVMPCSLDWEKLVSKDPLWVFRGLVMSSGLYGTEGLRGWGRRAGGRGEVSWAWRLTPVKVMVYWISVLKRQEKIELGRMSYSAEGELQSPGRLGLEGLTFVFISHVLLKRFGPTEPSRRSACIVNPDVWCLSLSLLLSRLSSCISIQRPRDLHERITE